MSTETRFKERYKTGNTPWDVGRADFNLIEVVTKTPIPGCKALDIGCGTGDNALWLARNRFQAVGTDASEIALAQAREKAAVEKVACDFIRADFLKERIAGAPFGFVFDRGCFHAFDTEKERRTFARNVAAHLAESGLWLSLVGSADEPRKGPGPPRRNAGQIVLAVEPFFEILSLSATHFESNRTDPPRAWRCLMRKRPH